MKKCTKLYPEPDCLLSFRTKNPNGTWDQFSGQDMVGYKTIREVTRKDQCGLCAFCELNLDEQNEQIAHFHPKSDMAAGHNWAYNWSNLWLACKGGSQAWMTNPDYYCPHPPLSQNISCDQKKGEKILDGEILAPHEIPAFPRIFRFEQYPNRMEIQVDVQACNEAGISVDKAQRTIEEFNLNCPRLAIDRLVLHRQLEQAIKRLQELKFDPQRGFETLVRQHLAKDTNGNWQRFFTLVRWRFSNKAEDYLRSINYCSRRSNMAA